MLLVAARLEPQKGHSVLLRAMSLLKSEFPNLRLVALGEGSLRRELERQVREFGLENSVRMPGHASRCPRLDDYRKHLRAAFPCRRLAAVRHRVPGRGPSDGCLGGGWNTGDRCGRQDWTDRSTRRSGGAGPGHRTTASRAESGGGAGHRGRGVGEAVVHPRAADSARPKSFTNDCGAQRPATRSANRARSASRKPLAHC